MNDSRSKAELHSLFLDELDSRITIGEFPNKANPVIIVEGILDSKIFASIRISHGPEIVSIEDLISSTIGYKSERNKMKSAKDLVRIVKKKLCDNGFENVIGIQDSDLDSVIKWYEGDDFKLLQKGKGIFQTFPSRDVETMLYSQLSESSKFVEGFPVRFQDCIDRSIVLAVMGISLNVFNQSSKISPLGLNRFSSDKKKNLENYFIICENVEMLFNEFIKYHDNMLNENLLEKLKTTVIEVKTKLENSNLNWPEIIRGHDLEALLLRFNKLGVKKHWHVSKIKERLHALLVGLVDYECLNSHQMFTMIDDWRVERELSEFFA
jgi:hypothetical protein